jgi:1,4-alpha-glucan branching enzyme
MSKRTPPKNPKSAPAEPRAGARPREGAATKRTTGTTPAATTNPGTTTTRSKSAKTTTGATTSATKRTGAKGTARPGARASARPPGEETGEGIEVESHGEASAGADTWSSGQEPKDRSGDAVAVEVLPVSPEIYLATDVAPRPDTAPAATPAPAVMVLRAEEGAAAYLADAAASGYLADAATAGEAPTAEGPSYLGGDGETLLRAPRARIDVGALAGYRGATEVAVDGAEVAADGTDVAVGGVAEVAADGAEVADVAEVAIGGVDPVAADVAEVADGVDVAGGGPAAALRDWLAPADAPSPAAWAAGADAPLLQDLDYHLLAEGSHLRLYEKLGAHPRPAGGVHFAVWAPNARAVSVIGPWNAWEPAADPLTRHPSGVWSGVVAGAAPGMLYKYRVVGMRGEAQDKADPYALRTEAPPQTASVIADLEYEWHDAAWLARRAERQAPDAPISVYEVHLGSWLRGPDGEFLAYDAVADRLIAHVRALGFTHVEFLPLTEHPFYGSWGYQATAYFAPTARFGSPQQLMALIDRLHQADIGVLLDWVPAHFPADGAGLAYFDGTHLYEHADPRRGRHPDWNTLIFNLSRHEVKAFLLSSAMLWIERYHVDGLRVDAVASMLYLDYSRGPGQWVANEYGGRENLEAVAFLRALNQALHERCPGVITVAEESTSWPRVTEPSDRGGLGFDYKWDMGWMHDTLRYLGRDPLARKHHHEEISFRMWYAYNERYMLPLSHDEVVHCKGSLPAKMHGDLPARFASLRLLYAYMFGMPGKKLLFMGDEFGQLREWNHERGLDWELRAAPPHAGLERWVAALARLYRERPAMHALEHDPAGFQWLVVDDRERSVAVFVRKPASGPVLMFALNFTPVPWQGLRVGVAAEGEWTLLLRSDDAAYSGQPPATTLPEAYEATAIPAHGCDFSLGLTLPPLTALVLVGPDLEALRVAVARHRAAQAARAAEEAAAVAAARAAELARLEAIAAARAAAGADGEVDPVESSR